MPGPYGVSQTIQDILQKRREESRQAMVDKLQQDQVTANMKNQEQQLALEGRRTAATEAQSTSAIAQNNQQIAEGKERIFQSKLGSLGRGEREVSQDMQASDPDFYSELEKRMLTRQDPESTKSTFSPFDVGDIDPTSEEAAQLQQPGTVPGVQMENETIPVRNMFIGSPEYQEEQESIGRMDEIMKTEGLDSKTPSEKFMLFRRAGIENVPEWAAAGRRRAVPIHPGQRTPVDLEHGDVPVEFPYPPNPPASYITPQEWYLPNPADGNKLWSAWIRPGKPPSSATFMAPAPQGVTGSGPAGNITSARTNLQDFSTRLVPKYGRIDSQRVTNTMKNQLKSRAENNLIATELSNPPAAASAAMTVLDDIRQFSATGGNVPYGIGVILEDRKSDFPNLTQEDFDRIYAILNLVGSRYYRTQ